MKRYFQIAILAVVAIAANAMNDGEYNSKISDIVWKNSPLRGRSGVNADIVAPIVDDWIKTNAPATRGQELIAARWQMTLAAMNTEWEKFDKHFGVLCAETNAASRAAQFHQARNWFNGLRETTPLAARKGAREAMKRFVADKSGTFGDVDHLQMIPMIVTTGVKMYGSREEGEWDKYFEMIKAKPDIQPWRARAVGSAINALFPLGRDIAKAEFEKNHSLIGQEQETSFLLALADACVTANDRPGFDDVLARIKAYPMAIKTKPYIDILGKLNSFDAATSRDLLEEVLADKSVTNVNDRAAYLDCKIKFYSPAGFNYGFNEAGRYETWKKTTQERMALSVGIGANIYAGWSDSAVYYEDYAYALELIEKAMEKNPKDLELFYRRAVVKANTCDMQGAIADLETTGKHERLIAHLKGEKPKTTETIKELRVLSRELYKFRRYDDCRELQSFWEKNLFKEKTSKVHKVVFDADSPKNAEGFVRSKYYDDWSSMETRFENYGVDYHMYAGYDEKLLKTYTDKVNPDYRTGFKAIADTEGVHIFIRCEDPDIDSVKTGKRKNAGGLEIFFEPGDHEVPYHSIFFTDLPGTSDPHDSDWALPNRHYRRTKDCIFKDAVLTKSGVVAHMYMPWIGFYDTLPFDGRHWLLGIFRSYPGGMIGLSGAVHDLARGTHLEFPFKPQEIAALKERIALTAFNQYSLLSKDDGDYVLRWDDKLLGDPEFFAKEVKPLLDRLDKAGEALDQKETASWAELRYEISDRRKKYLKEKLLQE